jgi:ribose 5-phosphate isomerase A
VIIADESKQVPRLGRFPLPVEIAPFGSASIARGVARAAARAGCSGPIRRRGQSDHPFVTDGGHYILDCSFGAIPDPESLACELGSVPGVLGHGLFLGMATAVIVAGPKGVAVLGALDGATANPGAVP